MRLRSNRGHCGTVRAMGRGRVATGPTPAREAARLTAQLSLSRHIDCGCSVLRMRILAASRCVRLAYQKNSTFDDYKRIALCSVKGKGVYCVLCTCLRPCTGPPDCEINYSHL